MDKIDNVLTLFQEMKEDSEKQKFIEVQQATILELNKKLVNQAEEIEHLKSLLVSTNPLTVRVIVSPEEALLDEQIDLIQKRSYNKELTLEDVKKLDLLLKNKGLIKKDSKTLDASSRKLPISNEQLLEIIKNNGSK